ncbi:sensor histidine kinase [Noviluteimonas gilva]|uniref:Sensor histidine kinase n=1 Tax=Noviluteimonas gilva TaxID=2682097 RepID=A0A7C9HXQ6_9GAMM|nr:sensor histidine kinase [Lysobacter gilvus]MUV13474.1 sensor histidine kinase [Lysobacter gilvus]
MNTAAAAPIPPRIARLLARCGFAPAPDSAIADLIRQGKSPWTDAVHLLWSMWVFVTPMFGGGYTWTWVALTVVSYPVFIALYAKTLLSSRRVSDCYAYGMAVLCFVLLPWYPSGISYFVFGCVMLHAGKRHRAIPIYLLQWFVLNLLYAGISTAIGRPWQMIVWMPVMTLIIGLIINVERASADKDIALKLSHDEVRRLAATAERERIGRDLHDLLGHTLSLITLKLELARKLSERDPPGSRRELEEAERVARHALAEVRSAVTGIRSADLAAELASARLLLESSNVHLEYDAPPEVLPPDVERGLSLVLREAATNIARHAQATTARIAFDTDVRSVHMCVEDNGRGGVVDDGNGLAGMRDRVRCMGGTLSIESTKNRGTKVLVRVGLPA